MIIFIFANYMTNSGDKKGWLIVLQWQKGLTDCGKVKKTFIICGKVNWQKDLKNVWSIEWQKECTKSDIVD